MSVRIDATGEHFSRTTGTFASHGAFTHTMWVIRDVNRTGGVALHGMGNAGATQYAYLYSSNSDGTTIDFEVVTPGGNVLLNGPNMTLSVWYFFAWGRSGTGSNQTFLMYAPATSAALTVVTGTNNQAGSVATQEFYGANGYDTANGWLNGRLYASKQWTAGLTQAEIEAERWWVMPVRTLNLLTWHPFLVGGATTEARADYSGNARNLSGGTNSATGENPPVAWRRGRRRLVVPAGIAVLPPIYVFPSWIKV